MVENKGPEIAEVAIIFIVLCWVSTLLRCYVRIYIVEHFGLDDYLALASLVRTVIPAMKTGTNLITRRLSLSITSLVIIL